ncbi:MAG: FIST C-terminal domain-containing protein [Pelagimonas sp.]|jgi:hypothetical protein|nr:FIST C-terminal domain-containing protein [Pelagimonas sp.]
MREPIEFGFQMDGLMMDGASQGSAREGSVRENGQTALRIAQVESAVTDPVPALAQQLGSDPLSLLCLFASPRADFPGLVRAARAQFPAAKIMACTTAGELGQRGYEEGQIIAVGFPSALFAVEICKIPDLTQVHDDDIINDLILRRMQLNRAAPDMASEFSFLLVDGLSMREEHLTGVLSSGLGPMPLFGGSAGDGMDFRATHISDGDEILQNAALVALVRSHCPVKVFSLDNLLPTARRMVVTRATPRTRIVHEINAEPAAQEYARLLGMDPNQLNPFTFASHPVVVRLGNSHHVRAIQRASENGDLAFFSAIDEGMVLTLADHEEVADHLERGLNALSLDAPPDHILGCDCMLRRIDVEQVQKVGEVSQVLQNHGVVGFSTYGEQIGSLHVNQTLTGVAIYPPVPPVRLDGEIPE